MAIRTPRYKISPGGVGEYSIVLASGALTVVTADDPVWSFRWANSQLAAVIRRITLAIGVTTAYGTAQTTNYGLYFARTFTAADSGGTAGTLTTNNGKQRTSFPSTSISTGDLRISTTGAITAGTRTMDAQPLRAHAFATSALAAAGSVDWMFGGADDLEPLVLRYQEGLVLSNLVTMGASGVVKLYVGINWAEVPIADL